MKAVCIPCSGPVDITDFLPVVDHPIFQRLRRTCQLGVNSLIFPGAVHTRFEHAAGTLARVRRAPVMKMLGAPERRTLELFALLHDIGHGPFSHQIEPVLAGDHHQQGFSCLEAMSSEIAQCGVESEMLLRMMRGQERLALWVTDRNLGADKLDYLQRDAFHIGFSGIPDLDLIQQHTVMTECGLALSEKFIEDGKRLQKFYSYLHQHGYLNKTALAAQRLLQRALHEELARRGLSAESGMAQQIWQMGDAQLSAWLLNGASPLARTFAAALQERRLHRTCLCLKPEGYDYVENTVGKPITVLCHSRQTLARFCRRCENLDTLREMEDAMAAAVGLAPGDVLLASMPYFTKLLPRDMRIANGGENDYWLFDRDRDHRASLESDYLRTFAVRVVVPPQYREPLSRKTDLLLSSLGLEQ